jgi:hypothetical protein
MPIEVAGMTGKVGARKKLLRYPYYPIVWL